jgi:hypothetical protein
MGSQARSCNGWDAGLEGAEPRLYSFDSKGIGAAARLNIGIGGYGSRLKAGTAKGLFADSIFKQPSLSSSGLTGRSSTPRLLDSFSGVCGLSIHSRAPLRPIKSGDDE